MKVIVVGAGFAGLAAAIALQERRHQVTLLERRGVLGGRATSFADAASGEEVDNGPHVLLGAYRATLELLRRAGALELLETQPELRLDFAGAAGRSALRCWPLPAPLHVLGGVLSLRLPWRARWQLVRLGLASAFGPPPHGLTLADHFTRCGVGPEARAVLDLVAAVALNEAPSAAAAVLFHNVVRSAFLASRRASRIVFARTSWKTLSETLGRYLLARGGRLRRRALVEELLVEQARARGVRYRQRAETREEIRSGKPEAELSLAADAVVLAVPWGAVPGLIPEALRRAPPFERLGRLDASPAVTVELWLDRIALGEQLLGLPGHSFQWVLDTGRLRGRREPPQHLSLVATAAREALGRSNAELSAEAEATLRARLPEMAGAAVLRTLVLREPQATFAATPEAEALRPGNATPISGLMLAGDWTATGLPATIEGAVLSGFAAAESVQAAANLPGHA